MLLDNEERQALLSGDKQLGLCFCANVLWKVALATYKTRYAAEQVSKRSVEGRARSLLSAVIDCETRDMDRRRNC